jgi:retron-type reverse transcriptase
MNSLIELPSNNNYSVYFVPKGKGKWRKITAPSDELKSFQKKLMGELEKLHVHSSAHGFVKGRSISTNAFPHVKKKFVLSMDMKDFFPSIKRDMVEATFEFYQIDKRYIDYVLFEEGLPQGSPCSPTISNLYCHNLDLELSYFASQNQLSYTRYADDITMSGDNFDKTIIETIKAIVKRHRLVVHPRKTKVMWRNQRQIVTGVIVNDKLSMPVEKRKKMRALRHQYQNLPIGEKRVLAGLKGFDTSIKNGKITMEER